MFVVGCWRSRGGQGPWRVCSLVCKCPHMQTLPPVLCFLWQISFGCPGRVSMSSSYEIIRDGKKLS